jgi:desulfoferrodoxin-like iron-binding protein
VTAHETKHKTGLTVAPVALENAVAYLEAEVADRLDVGTHTLFVGQVVAAGILGHEDPMTYAHYHEVKKGVSPKTAPVYINPAEEGENAVKEQYRCTVCGYVYDPHPMEEKHFIEWIELLGDDRVHRRYLRPGEAPEAVFPAARDKKPPRANTAICMDYGRIEPPALPGTLSLEFERGLGGLIWKE